MVNEILKKRWAVVGFDYDTAKQLISEIEMSSGKEILKRKQTKYELCTYFVDGTTLKWVQAAESSRMNRIGKMWCDKNINEEILICEIMPIYHGKREDIIWV